MYRNFTSSNPPPALKAEFAKRGIVDHGSALFGNARTKHSEVFVMADGRTIPADSRIVGECARAAK